MPGGGLSGPGLEEVILWRQIHLLQAWTAEPATTLPHASAVPLYNLITTACCIKHHMLLSQLLLLPPLLMLLPLLFLLLLLQLLLLLLR